MPRWWSSRWIKVVLSPVLFLLGATLVGVLLSIGVFAQGSIEDRTDLVSWINGFKLGAERLSGMSRSSATGVTVGGTDVASLTFTTGAAVRTMTVNGIQGVLPAIQTIGAGGTIASDACGSLKRITAAAPVTTDTTNTFATPVAVPGCMMILRNVGAQTITLKRNALTFLTGGADVALATLSSITVVSDGITWAQITAQLSAT